MEPATVAWMDAIQARVGQVATMLGQMKGIKMMGFTGYFHSLVRQLRLDEIKISERLRILLVYLITLGSFNYPVYVSFAVKANIIRSDYFL